VPDFDVIVVGGGPAGAISALKCSELGLDVLLMERGNVGRHKPCGGVLTPICVDVVLESLGMSIPRDVMCSPATLGLYYVPPSGRRNGGSVKNFRLLNVNRDLFDQWLRQLAIESGVKIWYRTDLLKLRGSEPIQVSAKRGGRTFTMTTRYLIGADGVCSRVRSQLYGGIKVGVEPILQEHWRAEGDFGDYFYVFLRAELTPTYAYVIPKDGLYVVGVGVPKTNYTPISMCIDRFKEWLREEFAFKPRSLVRREAWAVPYGFLLEGVANTILVGDAAGFCNALTGEGIRLAVESGVAAGNAIQDATSFNKPLASTYRDHVKRISSFVCRVRQFTDGLTDEDREGFVNFELARISEQSY
jgi:geranylgeranyl reductase family protein